MVSLLCATGALLAQAQPSIIGTWKVIAYENHHADGTTDYPFGEKPAGYFVYDATGHLSVQIMRTPPMKDVPELRQGKGTHEQYKEALDSFVAYFGTYTVDAEKGIVTHHVEGASRPDYTGTDQPRPFRLEGDHLIIEIRRGKEYFRRELLRVR